MRLGARVDHAPGIRSSANRTRKGRQGQAVARHRHLAWTARRRALRTGAAGLALVGMVGAGWWLDATGRIAAISAVGSELALATTQIMGFRVDEVLVEGRVRVGQAELLRILNIERGMSIFAFRPDAVRTELTALGWVERAEATRRLPGTIFIRLTERQPIAVWQLDGRHALIDRNGVVITREGLEGFADLPQLVGPGAELHAEELLARLEAVPEIAAELAAAIWISERRWDLLLNQGTKVRLPEGDISTALLHLIEMQRDYAILGQEIVSIDLRIPDRLIVQLPPDGVAEPGATTPSAGQSEGQDT